MKRRTAPCGKVFEGVSAGRELQIHFINCRHPDCHAMAPKEIVEKQFHEYEEGFPELNY